MPTRTVRNGMLYAAQPHFPYMPSLGLLPEGSGAWKTPKSILLKVGLRKSTRYYGYSEEEMLQRVMDAPHHTSAQQHHSYQELHVVSLPSTQRWTE
jgi:hypothetical protein